MVLLKDVKVYMNEIYDLQKFINENKDSMEAEQVYSLERIYNNLNDEIKELIDKLETVSKMNDIDDMKEDLDDILLNY